MNYLFLIHIIEDESNIAQGNLIIAKDCHPAKKTLDFRIPTQDPQNIMVINLKTTCVNLQTDTIHTVEMDLLESITSFREIRFRFPACIAKHTECSASCRPSTLDRSTRNENSVSPRSLLISPARRRISMWGRAMQFKTHRHASPIWTVAVTDHLFPWCILWTPNTPILHFYEKLFIQQLMMAYILSDVLFCFQISYHEFYHLLSLSRHSL